MSYPTHELRRALRFADEMKLTKIRISTWSARILLKMMEDHDQLVLSENRAAKRARAGRDPEQVRARDLLPDRDALAPHRPQEEADALHVRDAAALHIRGGR